MWLLFRTLKLKRFAYSRESNPYERATEQRFLYCVWHDSMVIPTFGGRHPNTTALTSQHADGSFVAQVLKWNRIAAIRGSTRRISTGALRELMRRTESQHIVITPDGPRGPARSMSPGIVFLASRTGRAVVPTAYACSSYWRIKGSWSDLIIPKPFAKVILLAGEPISVPADLSGDQLRAVAGEVERAMEHLQCAAEEQLVTAKQAVA